MCANYGTLNGHERAKIRSGGVCPKLCRRVLTFVQATSENDKFQRRCGLSQSVPVAGPLADTKLGTREQRSVGSKSVRRGSGLQTSQRDDFRSNALRVDQHVEVPAVQIHDRPSLDFGSFLFLCIRVTEGEVCGGRPVPSSFDL